MYPATDQFGPQVRGWFNLEAIYYIASRSNVH